MEITKQQANQVNDLLTKKFAVSLMVNGKIEKITADGRTETDAKISVFEKYTADIDLDHYVSVELLGIEEMS